MRSLGPHIFFFLLILAAAITLACGSGSSPVNSHVGLLESVTLTPATAAGQAQFTATGYYSEPPSPVSPLKVTWGACYQNASTTEVSVSNSGFAQCADGASGTYTVWGYAMSGAGACPAIVTACGGGGCQVTGTAQLTCP